MSRRFMLMSLVVAAALLVGCGSGGGSPLPDGDNSITTMIARHNATRTSEGLPALSENVLLDEIAQDQADYMASIDTLTHVDALGRHVDGRATAVGYNWVSIGENIGYDTSASNLYQAWLGSPGHFDNIVDPSYDDIGVGKVDVGGYEYWCIVFGSR